MAAFHEMGHALNKNTAGLGKILQKARTPFAILSSIAVYTGVFKRKKAQGEKPKGAWDKATTFVKNNCATLAVIGSVPIVAEEAMASFKGAKLAKSLKISPEMLKNLNKFHGVALLTYAGTTVGMGLAAVVGRAIRDSIASPKEITLKTENKE